MQDDQEGYSGIHSMNVVEEQILIQNFFHKYKVPYTIVVDGHWGAASHKAAEVAQLCLGWKPKYATGVRSERLWEVLRNPNKMKPIQRARGLAYRELG